MLFAACSSTAEVFFISIFVAFWIGVLIGAGTAKNSGDKAMAAAKQHAEQKNQQIAALQSDLRAEMQASNELELRLQQQVRANAVGQQTTEEEKLRHRAGAGHAEVEHHDGLAKQPGQRHLQGGSSEAVERARAAEHHNGQRPSRVGRSTGAASPFSVPGSSTRCTLC